MPRSLLFLLALLLPAVLAACSSSRDPGGTDGGGIVPDGATADGGATECTGDEQYFYPGCGSGEDVTITEGCYLPCEGADDTSCPSGRTCQRSDINPCVCPAGEGCCAACGAEQWLCLEPPAPGVTELESLDAPCEGSITGEELLARFAERYVGTLSYHDDTPATDFTLTVTYDGGRILCHPPFDPPPGSGAPSLPAHTEVEVAVGFDTDDGAFAESIDASVDGAAFGSSAQLSSSIAAEDIMGTYEPGLTGVTNISVSVNATLDLEMLNGGVAEGGETGTGVGMGRTVGNFEGTPEAP